MRVHKVSQTQWTCPNLLFTIPQATPPWVKKTTLMMIHGIFYVCRATLWYSSPDFVFLNSISKSEFMRYADTRNVLSFSKVTLYQDKWSRRYPSNLIIRSTSVTPNIISRMLRIHLVFARRSARVISLHFFLFSDPRI